MFRSTSWLPGLVVTPVQAPLSPISYPIGGDAAATFIPLPRLTPSTSEMIIGGRPSAAAQLRSTSVRVTPLARRKNSPYEGRVPR